MSQCRREISPRAPDTGARKHRKIAIGGWLAFVVIAFVLGGAIGTKTLADEDSGNGESRVADKAITARRLPGQGRRAGPRSGPRRQAHGHGPARSRPRVDDVVTQLKARQGRHRRRVAARQGQRGPDLQGRPLRARHVHDPGRREARRQGRLHRSNATAAAQRQHPDLRIEQFGDASADKALGASLDDDFKRAEFLSLPITLIILIVAFGALVAAGVPLLLAITAVVGTLGLVGPISQIIPMEESANSRDPADRPRGRRRLLDVLPAAENGGARRGTLERSRARVRRRHVRQGRARSPASRC